MPRLGICTKYAHCEATCVALRIADWTRQHGHDVTLFPTPWSAAGVTESWDAAAHAARGQLFADWAAGCTAVLWTHCPPQEQLRWVNRRKIRTAIFPLHRELMPGHKAVCQDAAALFAGTQILRELFIERWQISGVFLAPWDAGVPFTLKDDRIRPASRRLLLSLLDQASREMEVTAIDVAGRALSRYTDTQLTVAYSASTLAGFAKRRLSEIQRCFPDRVHLVTRVPFTRLPILYQEHDLLLWPTHAESLGIAGLLSMSMGTPAIAFSFAPLCEFMNPRNSIPTYCREHVDSLGVSHPDPNYHEFEKQLWQVLQDRDCLPELQEHVHEGLSRRRALFDKALERGLFSP